MNPLHFCIAISPLAVYCLVLGILCLRRRPFVTTNARDVSIIGMAVSGMIVIGPMELFFPEAAVARFGPFVWVMLISFYALCLSMIALLVRPGIILYNVQYDQLRPVLAEVLSKMDTPQWMGENVRLPKSNIQFHVEVHPWLRTVNLTSCGSRQNLNAWRQLEIDLGKTAASISTKPNILAPVFLCFAGLLAITSATWMFADADSVVVAFREMLRQ